VAKLKYLCREKYENSLSKSIQNILIWKEAQNCGWKIQFAGTSRVQERRVDGILFYLSSDIPLDI